MTKPNDPIDPFMQWIGHGEGERIGIRWHRLFISRIEVWVRDLPATFKRKLEVALALIGVTTIVGRETLDATRC